MTLGKPRISVLLIDDDEEYLELLPSSVSSVVEDLDLVWDLCKSFDEGLKKLSQARYDAVLSDVYVGAIEKKEAAGLSIVEQIRAKQFCPILLVSAGAQPEGLSLSAFVNFASKVGDEVENASKLLLGGIPRIVSKIHAEIDRFGGSYLWEHLELEWSRLRELVEVSPEILERIIRRRIAVQMYRMLESGGELETVKGLEFYLYPCISGSELRLGDVIRHKETGDFRVILTPHCHMKCQVGQEKPRADFILTIKTVDAKEVFKSVKEFPKRTKVDKYAEAIRKRIKPEPDIGSPEGRYWFLPGFLDIPEVYCDFLQAESLSYSDLMGSFERVATLDVPFAESLQSCFGRFYAAVGVPDLVPQDFFHLREEDVAAVTSGVKEMASGGLVDSDVMEEKSSVPDSSSTETAPEESSLPDPPSTETVPEEFSLPDPPSTETAPKESSFPDPPSTETAPKESSLPDPPSTETAPEERRDNGDEIET